MWKQVIDSINWGLDIIIDWIELNEWTVEHYVNAMKKIQSEWWSEFGFNQLLWWVLTYIEENWTEWLKKLRNLSFKDKSNLLYPKYWVDCDSESEFNQKLREINKVLTHIEKNWINLWNAKNDFINK